MQEKTPKNKILLAIYYVFARLLPNKYYDFPVQNGVFQKKLKYDKCRRCIMVFRVVE